MNLLLKKLAEKGVGRECHIMAFAANTIVKNLMRHATAVWRIVFHKVSSCH